MWLSDVLSFQSGSFHLLLVVSYSILLLFHTFGSFHTLLTFPTMASPSKSGLKTSLCNNPKPHVFKTFDPAEDYESFQRHIILPIICKSHDNQSIHYTQKPTLPLPVVFAPDRHSIESVYQLILDTDVNLTNITPFVHHVGYPLCQSASILNYSMPYFTWLSQPQNSWMLHFE